jgi:flagellar hook-associated protein 3 FlgL
MLNRVATSTQTNQMMENLQASSSSLSEIEGQVASGKRIQQVSDDPTSAISALAQRAELSQTTQYSRNANDATDWLNTTDSALSSVVTALQSAHTSLVQAQSGGLDSASRAAIASQLQASVQSLLATANTTRLGRPIFAGTAGVTQAFDSSGNYLGDSGAVNRTVATGVNIGVNQTGDAVFGTYNASDPTTGNVFQLLQSLSNAVSTGNTSAITAGLNQLDSATARVENAQVSVGATTNQVSGLLDQATTATSTLQSGINSLEDVDIAQASITLATRQMAYQAALAAAAKISQPTLLDFLH